MDSTNFQIVKILNPFDRTKKQVSHRVYCHETLQRICDDYKIEPGDFIVSLNGLIIESIHWDSCIPRADDSVLFIPMVHGGDGDKEVLGIAAMIALTLFSGGLASGLASGWVGGVQSDICGDWKCKARDF